MSTRPRQRTAFTLIELLVVSSIVALLLAILLPALGMAREVGRRTACAAHMRGAVTGMLTYVSENYDWLPGPHTSGYGWSVSPNYGGNSYGLDSVDPGESGPSNRPTQNLDWASPSLATVLNLPGNDLDRIIKLYGTELACPSNAEFYNHVFNGSVPGGPGRVRYSSYSAAITFHAWPEIEARIPSLAPISTITTSSAFTYPANYAPRLDKIGPPSTKVFLQEGSRFISGSNGNYQVSLNLARHQEQGGGFMCNGTFAAGNGDNGIWLPTTSAFNGTWTGELTERNRRFAYRHSYGMNLAYFDGHVAYSQVREMWPLEKWAPTGSVVQFKQVLYANQNYQNGQVIR